MPKQATHELTDWLCGYLFMVDELEVQCTWLGARKGESHSPENLSCPFAQWPFGSESSVPLGNLET